MARALWVGFRGRGEGLAPVWPAAWLLIAALFLIGLRTGLDLADSGVIDVGYASEVGASRIANGKPIYGNFPKDVSLGDTYGPVNYLAYVPFERIWPWSGSWNDLPAAHGAAVFFDLATFALLIFLGMRIRPGPAGKKLAATLAFGWAAYPYTAFALESNSNDTLVALLLVATLLVLARPVARGAMAALATLTKFAPVVLVPMLATYRDERSGDGSARRAGPVTGRAPAGGAAAPFSGPSPRHPRAGRFRSIATFVLAFALASAAVLTWPAVDPGLHTVYERTIAYQAGRDSPFSIWGQVPSLEPLRIALLVAMGALSLLLAFRPRRKSLVQVAALGAGLLIALQLTMHHWFYLYIVWFYPLLLVALVGVGGRSLQPPRLRRAILCPEGAPNCTAGGGARRKGADPRPPPGYGLTGAGTITSSIESASPSSLT